MEECELRRCFLKSFPPAPDKVDPLTDAEESSRQKVQPSSYSGFNRFPVTNEVRAKFREGCFDVADCCPTMEETVGGNRGGGRLPELPGSGAGRAQAGRAEGLWAGRSLLLPIYGRLTPL